MSSRSMGRVEIRDRVVVLLVSTVLWTSASAQVAGPPVFFVKPDPSSGKDEPGSGLSPTSPFLTIQYALDRAAEKVRDAADVKVRGVSLHLLSGTYSDAPGEARQAFPVNIPQELERVKIVGPLAPEKARITGSSTGEVSGLIQFSPYTGVKGVVIEIRDLEIQGGFSGLLLRGVESEDLRVTLSGCTFLGQRTTGLHVSSRAKAKISVALSGCLFQGGSGGVMAGSGESGELRIAVDGCKFTDLRRYAPGGTLGSGVDVYLEPFSKVWAVVTRSYFRGVASAVQLTEAEEDVARQPTGGELRALVLSNVVNGLSGDGYVNGSGVTNGVYLSLWPHHRNDIFIVNNTFDGVSRNVVYHDNLLTLAELDLGLAPVTFANNICRGTGGASELDDEVFVFGEEEPGEHFASAGSVVRNNILARSRRGLEGTDGNFIVDPLFVNEAASDFRLRYGSPAVDRGESSFGGSFDQFGEPNLLDFSGDLCRRASEICSIDGQSYPIDLGAHEREGFCDAEAAVFTRGDCNGSKGFPMIADAIFTFYFLFLGGQVPTCMDACDANDDGKVNISDGIYTLAFLFLGGPPPPPPYDPSGSDPTRDCLQACGKK